MNFINNWQRPITLAQAATETAIDLPDGSYRLTLTDSASAPTRWEIVDASVSNGSAVLVRGLEGTSGQLWPMGSVIYCDITAGVLEEMQVVAPTAGSSVFRKGTYILPGSAVQASATPAIYFAIMSALPAGTLEMPAMPDMAVGETQTCVIEIEGSFEPDCVLYLAPPVGMQFWQVSTSGESALNVTYEEMGDPRRAMLENGSIFVSQRVRLEVEYERTGDEDLVWLLVEMLPQRTTTRI